jgi:hypothetical protein
VSSFYSRRIYIASVVLAGLVSYALGARRGVFVIAVLLGTLPFFFVIFLFARFFDPPKLERSDDYSLDLNRRSGRDT